jgi:hypothetical protein
LSDAEKEVLWLAKQRAKKAAKKAPKPRDKDAFKKATLASKTFYGSRNEGVRGENETTQKSKTMFKNMSDADKKMWYNVGLKMEEYERDVLNADTETKKQKILKGKAFQNRVNKILAEMKGKSQDESPDAKKTGDKKKAQEDELPDKSKTKSKTVSKTGNSNRGKGLVADPEA